MTNLWGLAVRQGRQDLGKQKSEVCQGLSRDCSASLSPVPVGLEHMVSWVGKLMQPSLWLSTQKLCRCDTPGYSLLPAPSPKPAFPRWE